MDDEILSLLFSGHTPHAIGLAILLILWRIVRVLDDVAKKLELLLTIEKVRNAVQSD